MCYWDEHSPLLLCVGVGGGENLIVYKLSLPRFPDTIKGSRLEVNVSSKSLASCYLWRKKRIKI